MQHLPGISFCRGNRFFASGVNQKRFVGDFCHRRIGFVGDAEVNAPDFFALSRTVLMSAPSPDCETPMTSARLQIQFRVIKRKNRRRGERNRNSGRYFQQITPEKRGVIRTSARDQNDQINVSLRAEIRRAFLVLARFPLELFFPKLRAVPQFP